MLDLPAELLLGFQSCVVGKPLNIATYSSESEKKEMCGLIDVHS